MDFRQALTRTRRGLVLLALLCILLARVAVPAGWMPMAAADGGLVLVPCSGMGATTLVAADMAGMHMPGMAAGHEGGEGQRHPDPSGDHPCSGAGVAAAIATPLAMAPVGLPIRPAIVVARTFIVMIGQGLAAPPPPQTGPPIRV